MLAQATQAVETAAAVPLNSTDKHLVAAGLIALALKFLIDALRKIDHPRAEVATYLPWVVSLLGVAAGAVDHYLMDASVTDSVIVAGAGGGSVLFNELGNALRKALSKPVTEVNVSVAVKAGTEAVAEEKVEPPKDTGTAS